MKLYLTNLEVIITCCIFVHIMKEKDLHIKISKELLDKAKEIANKYEMSLSSMVRFIIKDFIERDS